MRFCREIAGAIKKGKEKKELEKFIPLPCRMDIRTAIQTSLNKYIH